MTSLSMPRTALAVAIAAATIAAVAGCQQQASTPSSPAALSTPDGPKPHSTRIPKSPRTSISPTSTPTTQAPLVSSPGSDATTPAPASTSPSPDPATSAPSAGTCTTSAAQGSCGPYTYSRIQGSSQDPTVAQDVWNPISGWQQTLYATSPGSWHVAANMPAGNTGVVSFPDTGAAYGEQPLSKFSEIYSSFSENMNATAETSAWAAYDLWFNNWANEVMIQHDFAGSGPCTFVATQSFGGSGGVPVQTWGLCQYGTELIWKLTGGNEQTGSVDILAMVIWLENHGYLPSASTITDLSYGFEICSTGGQDENFQVNSFSITAS